LAAKVNKKSASFTFLVLSVVLIPCFAVTKAGTTEDGAWTTLMSLSSPFYETIGAAVVDEDIYFFGGNITLQYGPEADAWEPRTPVPFYNGWAAVAVCENKIYVIGENPEMPTLVYDPATDSWENRTGLPSTKFSVQANVVDGKIYVIGGRLPAPLGVVSVTDSNDVYDPETDSWSKMEPIPIPVMGYASAVLDDKIYVIGGGVANEPEYVPVTYVQIFDPKTDQWTNGTQLPEGVCYARACATTGAYAPKRLYVIGGNSNYYFRNNFYTATNLTQIYNPETEAWTVGAYMPTTRSKLGVAVVKDEIYAIGGHNSIDWSTVVYANEKYTPVAYTEASELFEFGVWLIVFVVSAVLVLIVSVFALRKAVL
jgi:hypothetical protein